MVSKGFIWFPPCTIHHTAEKLLLLCLQPSSSLSEQKAFFYSTLQPPVFKLNLQGTMRFCFNVYLFIKTFKLSKCVVRLKSVTPNSSNSRAKGDFKKKAASALLLLPSALLSSFSWSIDTTHRTWMFILFFCHSAKRLSNEIILGGCKSYNMRLGLLTWKTRKLH